MSHPGRTNRDRSSKVTFLKDESKGPEKRKIIIFGYFGMKKEGTTKV